LKTNQNLQTKIFNRVVFSHKTYKWNTPLEAYNELDKEFHFDCDPFHPPIVGKFHGNAFTKDWYGRVFGNPMYDRTLTKRCILRGWTQLVQNKVELIVWLLPSRSGNNWFHFLNAVGAEWRIVRGSIINNSTTISCRYIKFIII